VLQPSEWSVVVVGSWNLAILTPNGVATRIFKVEPNTPLEVFVPIDGMAPYQIKSPDGDLVAMCDGDRLSIKAMTMTYETLAKAMAAAVNALEWLPETPYRAAGFNVNYKSDEQLDELTPALESRIDVPLAKADFTISGRATHRSLKFGEGTLKLSIGSDVGGGCDVRCNFHRGTNAREELVEWLQTPIKKVSDAVQRLFERLGIQVQEGGNSDDGE